MHDIVGHYNRFDIFRLHVDDRPRTALTLASELAAAPPYPNPHPNSNPPIRTHPEEDA